MRFKSVKLTAPPPSNVPEAILGNIRWRAERIDELQDYRPIATVNTADVHHAQVRYGFRAQHPVFQFIFGLLIVVGMAPFALSFLSGVIISSITIFSGVTMLIGVYVIADSLRRGHVLLFYLQHGQRKISFGKYLSKPEIDTFIAEAKKLSPIPIDNG